MNFLDRYHKAVTPSGVNFGKGLMSFWYWTNLGLYWCINRYIKVTRLFFNELFMFDMACPRWWIILGRCWADVGPVGPTSGHWRPCFLGYLGHCMTDHYGGIAYCFLCIVYSYFHVCFICSLTHNFMRIKDGTTHPACCWTWSLQLLQIILSLQESIQKEYMIFFQCNILFRCIQNKTDASYTCRGISKDTSWHFQYVFSVGGFYRNLSAYIVFAI